MWMFVITPSLAIRYLHQWFTISTTHLTNTVWVSTTPGTGYAPGITRSDPWTYLTMQWNRPTCKQWRAKYQQVEATVLRKSPREEGLQLLSSQKDFSTAGQQEATKKNLILKFPKKSAERLLYFTLLSSRHNNFLPVKMGEAGIGASLVSLLILGQLFSHSENIVTVTCPTA